MITARITIATPFPAFNLLEVLRGNLPTGITIDKTYPQLPNGCRRLVLSNLNPDRFIWEGADSGVTPANAGRELPSPLTNPHAVIEYEDPAGRNSEALNKWFMMSDGALNPAGGTIGVTVDYW